MSYIDTLQSRYGLTYKEARVYLAGSGKGVNAKLAEEFGVDVHAIYNLRRRARRKVKAAHTDGDDATMFCDIDSVSPETEPMESPTLDSIVPEGQDRRYDYTMDMFRLQELAGLSFMEAQAYLCSIGWESEESFRGRTGMSEEELDDLLKTAYKIIAAAEPDDRRILVNPWSPSVL